MQSQAFGITNRLLHFLICCVASRVWQTLSAGRFATWQLMGFVLSPVGLTNMHGYLAVLTKCMQLDKGSTGKGVATLNECAVCSHWDISGGGVGLGGG